MPQKEQLRWHTRLIDHALGSTHDQSSTCRTTPRVRRGQGPQLCILPPRKSALQIGNTDTTCRWTQCEGLETGDQEVSKEDELANHDHSARNLTESRRQAPGWERQNRGQQLLGYGDPCPKCQAVRGFKPRQGTREATMYHMSQLAPRGCLAMEPRDAWRVPRQGSQLFANLYVVVVNSVCIYTECCCGGNLQTSM